MIDATMVKPDPSQFELVGRWILVDGHARADSICEQIAWLTTNHFRKIASSKKWGDWEILFRDPDDKRFWEQTYPHGEMHGGGPPQLRVISPEQAQNKYHVAEAG